MILKKSFLIILFAILAIVLILGLLKNPPKVSEMANHVADNLSQSGVLNPVTATLINFRGYDTLLEIAVIFLALMVAFSLGFKTPKFIEEKTSPIILGFVGLFVPLIWMLSGYLLWVGAFAPGGAFPAGALLCSSGWLIYKTGNFNFLSNRSFLLNFLYSFGFLVFLSYGLVSLIIFKSFLKFPANWAGEIIFCIESATVISLGFILFFFINPKSSNL